MSTLKKVLALTLALAMILSVSAFAGFYKADTYKDAASIDKDCEDAVELMYALDIMQGDAQGNFRPNDTITRAEIAKMIYVIKNYGKDDKAVTYQDAKIFSDVPATAWYAGYVNYCGVTKLIQGRGNGTFGPTDPVTTAAAAKMLLTAIGYDAEARGYVGANWDKNVLSDAAIVGLLDDYNYSTIGAAPRQWVAVMFDNALTHAYTYKTMVAIPTNGLLSAATQVNGGDNIVTFGEKYYGMVVKTLYASATSTVRLDGKTAKVSDGYVEFIDGKGNTVVALKGTGLKTADLGQQYKAIFKYTDKNEKLGSALSVRATGKSVVAEGRIKDYEVKVSYGTDANLAANDYVFSVGETELTVAAEKLHVLTLDPSEKSANTVRYTTKTAVKAEVVKAKNAVKNPTAEQINADMYKAIDRNGDGEIDYVIVTKYLYAQIDKVDSSKYYGDFVTAKKPNGEYLTFSKSSKENLYLDDCIVCDSKLEEGNVVKYSWNADEGMYNFEVLPVSNEVKYEKRSAAKGIHVLGGEEYMVSSKGWEAKVLTSGNLGETMDFVSDGDLLVMIDLTDSNYTDIADVNAQLVLVTDVNNEFSNQGIYNNMGIEYMTIDGETHIATYVNKSTTVSSTDETLKYVQYADLYKLSSQKYHTEINEDGQVVAVNNWAENANGAYTYTGRLFILHESGNKVYLEALNDAKVNTQLNASTTLLDGYYAEGGKKMDATGSTVRFDGMKLVGENSYFVGYENDDGDAVYKVMTADKLGNGTDNNAYAQLLTKDNSRGTITTAVAGYLNINLEGAESKGYLYITDVNYEDEDGIAYTVVLDDATEPTQVYLSSASKKAIKDCVLKIAEQILYKYTYNKINDDYTLTQVEFGQDSFECEIFDLDGVELYAGRDADRPTVSKLDKETIAIVDVTVELEVGNEDAHDPLAFKYGDVTAKFVDLEDLEASMIVNGEYEGQGVYRFSDYCYTANDILYVIVYHVENYANGGAEITGATLYNGLMNAVDAKPYAGQ